MSEAMTDRLCRIVLMDLLPALVEEDFRGVSESLYKYGQEVGSYFEPIQGGRFASRQMEQLAKFLRDQGHLGVGQSSWGPAMFVLEESQAAAESLVRELQQDRLAADCTFHIARALNQGAKITIEKG
jgi:predicted sugar kinase